MSGPSLVRRSRRGMSLLEAMVGIAILLVMTVVTYSVLDSTIQTRNLLAERDGTTRSARVTLGRLRREVQLAFLSSHPEAVNTYETVFVGTDDNPDRLFFASLAHQRLYRDSRESDQTEITVWAEPSPERGQGYTLYHREAPRVDEEPHEGGVIYPIATNVRTFNVQYLDSRTNEWTDEWDTRTVDQANRLPRAIRLGIVLVSQETDVNGDPVEAEVPFVTTITLERGEKLQASPFNENTLPPDASNNETPPQTPPRQTPPRQTPPRNPLTGGS
jgi:general secretion pathway protein J